MLRSLWSGVHAPFDEKDGHQGVNRAFTAGFERAVHCLYTAGFCERLGQTAHLTLIEKVSNEPRFTVNDAHDM